LTQHGGVAQIALEARDLELGGKVAQEGVGDAEVALVCTS
jgi:hypothetical protein